MAPRGKAAALYEMGADASDSRDQPVLLGLSHEDIFNVWLLLPNGRGFRVLFRQEGFPKKKVFTKDKDGKHLLVSEGGDLRSFSDYLNDFSDRETALQEYSSALKTYHEKLHANTDFKAQTTASLPE